jgi:hypothetical protein
MCGSYFFILKIGKLIMIKLFDDSGLVELKKILDENCVDGKCLKATDVCELAGLDSKKYREIISFIVKMDMVPEYRNYLGPGKGIGRKDTPPVKTTGAKTSQVDLSEDFLEELRDVLPRLCANGLTVSRKKIVEQMKNVPEKNPEALVSAALKLDEFENYSIKTGKNGGVFLKQPSIVESKLESELDSSLENAMKHKRVYEPIGLASWLEDQDSQEDSLSEE